YGRLTSPRESLLAHRPSAPERFVDSNQAYQCVGLTLNQAVLGGIHGSLGIKDRQEILQAASVSLGCEIKRTAIRINRGTERLEAALLPALSRQCVLNLLDRCQHGLLVQPQCLLLSCILHLDVGPDATAREYRHPNTGEQEPELTPGCAEI